KLPVDAFDQAVAEIDTCYDRIRQSDNPFAAPEPTAKQPAKPSGTTTSATPPMDSRPANLTPAASTGAGRDTELTEERTFLTIRGNRNSYRLEALVVR